MDMLQGSNYSRASTVLEENKERSQVNLKRKLDIPSVITSYKICLTNRGQILLQRTVTEQL